MNVHADVHERDQVPAAGNLELAPLGEAVHAAEDDVAAAKRLRTLLPAAAETSRRGRRCGRQESCAAPDSIFGRARLRVGLGRDYQRFRFDSSAPSPSKTE